MGKWFGGKAGSLVSNPWFGGGEELTQGEVETVISGDTAGNHALTGIKTTDVIISVIFTNPNGGGAGISNEVDLTSEFTISATDQINNTGGTDSSAGTLTVTFASQNQRL